MFTSTNYTKLFFPGTSSASKSPSQSHASRVADDVKNRKKIYNWTPNPNAIVKTGPSVAITSGSQSQSSSSGSGTTSENSAGEDVLSGGSSGDGSSGSSGSSSGGDSSEEEESSGTVSPLLEGNMSFQELVAEICNGIDLVFVCKRSTVVVTDYETLFAEAKYLRDNYHSSVKAEDIALWQLEDGSYELDVNEYGFYTTVKVHYKNGTITESYEDLVRVYGNITKEYDEPTIDKTTAIMKAKAYLAAHVRDFDMSVKASLLHDADIDIGDIVTLENPMTMRDQYRQDSEKRDPEYLFVMGNSISWDGEGPILNDIELRYGAKSPEKKEVPETGSPGYSDSTTDDVQGALDEVGKAYSGYKYCHACQTAECTKSKKCGDCWGMSDLIACELQAKGVTTKIVQYAATASNHRSVLYKDSDGSWKDFPYRQYGFNSLFNNTSGSKKGKEVSKSC